MLQLGAYLSYCILLSNIIFFYSLSIYFFPFFSSFMLLFLLFSFINSSFSLPPFHLFLFFLNFISSILPLSPTQNFFTLVFHTILLYACFLLSPASSTLSHRVVHSERGTHSCTPHPRPAQVNRHGGGLPGVRVQLSVSPQHHHCWKSA